MNEPVFEALRNTQSLRSLRPEDWIPGSWRFSSLKFPVFSIEFFLEKANNKFFNKNYKNFDNENVYVKTVKTIKTVKTQRLYCKDWKTVCSEVKYFRSFFRYQKLILKINILICINNLYWILICLHILMKMLMIFIYSKNFINRLRKTINARNIRRQIRIQQKFYFEIQIWRWWWRTPVLKKKKKNMGAQ